MSMFNIFKLGGRPKPQPQQEFLTHEGMSLFYEQTISQIRQTTSKIQSQLPQASSSSSTPRSTTAAATAATTAAAATAKESDLSKVQKISENVVSHMKQISSTETTKEKKTERIERDMKDHVNFYFDPLHHALHGDLLVGLSHSQQQLLLVAIHTMQEQVIDCVQVCNQSCQSPCQLMKSMLVFVLIFFIGWRLAAEKAFSTLFAQFLCRKLWNCESLYFVYLPSSMITGHLTDFFITFSSLFDFIVCVEIFPLWVHWVRHTIWRHDSHPVH